MSSQAHVKKAKKVKKVKKVKNMEIFDRYLNDNGEPNILKSETFNYRKQNVFFWRLNGTQLRFKSSREWMENEALGYKLTLHESGTYLWTIIPGYPPM